MKIQITKRFTFAVAILPVLFFIPVDMRATIGQSIQKENKFASQRTVIPDFLETLSINRKKWNQTKVSVCNPAISNLKSNPFDAINWFDLIKKTFGGRVSGHIHGEITKTAFKELKIKNEVIRKVIEANWRMDWDEYHKVLPPVPNDKYNPAHHFDRTYGAAHSDSFKRGAKYIREQRSIVLAGLRGEGGRTLNDALQAMGRALHALQDFFSHSNVIDLSPEDWDAAMIALETGTDPPASLKITGYDRVGNLVGDEYAHDTFSKENPHKNEESKSRMKAGAYAYHPNKTKFQRAKEAAAESSKKWLIDIREEAGRPAWKQIEKP